MKIAIYTQHRENYGAHDWDGTGACPQYWKNKGGETFVIPGLTMDQVRDWEYHHQSTVYSLLCESSDYFEVTIAGMNILADDAEVCESWETPWTLTEVDGVWTASRFCPAEDYWNPGYTGKNESYTLGANGERLDYFYEYQKDVA